MESKREWLIIMVMYIYANKALESSNNMSICRTEIWGCNSESSDNATMVMRKIKNKSLREALEIIEKNRDFLFFHFFDILSLFRTYFNIIFV